MAWPNTSLPIEVKLELGANPGDDPTTFTFATDISTKTFDRNGNSSIVIMRGRVDEQSEAQPSTCELTVNNTDGRFSARNPAGAYYPDLRRNTPIRVRINPGSGLSTRYVGFVSEWPPRWDVSESDFFVPVHADGILRRLSQGQSPLKSALSRAVKFMAVQPTYYWPLEEGSDAPMALSGIAGGPSLAPTSTDFSLCAFGAETRVPGSAPMVSLGAFDDGTGTGNAGRFDDVSIPGLGSTGFSLAFVFVADFASIPVTTDRYLFKVNLTGGNLSFVAVSAYAATETNIPSTATFGMDTATSSGAVENNFATSPNPYDGKPHALLVTFAQVGADVNATTWIDGVRFANDFGLQLGKTLGTPTTLRFNEMLGVSFGGTTDVSNNSGTKLAVGHVCLWAGGLTPTDLYTAMTGHAGELTGDRFSRLCTEEGIAADVTSGSTETMGPQGTQTLLELLRECEAVEEGLLVERVDGRLGFTPRVNLYNQTVALTLDYASGHIAPPIEPTDDDQRIRNDVTVTRTDGPSGANAVDQSGPVGVATVGRFTESVELNLFADYQAQQHAEWRLHLGTVDELRFPTITVNLRRGSSLAASFLALDIGSRIQITNLPDSVSVDDVDLIVEGYTEQISQKNWLITFNCAPASPYLVGSYQDLSVVSADRPTRYDGRFSTTSGSFVSGAGSLSVATSFAPLWTTTGPFPMFVKVRGVILTVSAIAGASSPQTFTVTDANLAGVTIPSGSEVHVVDVGRYAL